MRRTWLLLDLTGAGISLLLAVVTLIWHDWIELLFQVEPDGGTGAGEVATVAILGAVSLALSLAATAQWRRVRLSEQGR